MKRSLLTAVLVFIVSCIYSQSDFSRGYLINSQNDTLYGFLLISYNNNDYGLDFKKSNIAKKITSFKPEMISSFFLERGELFVTRRVARQNDSVSVFLKCLIKGKVNLYSWIDKNLKERFFIESKKYGLRELTYSEKIITDRNTGRRFLQKYKSYIGELKMAFIDCPQLTKKLDQCGLNEKNLTNSVKDYHFCTNSTFQQYEASYQQLKRPEIGVFAGLNRIGMVMVDNSQFISLWGYNLGINLNFYPTKANSRYSYEIGYQISRIGSVYVPTEELMDDIYHHIPLLFNRYYRSNNSILSVSTGIDFGFSGMFNMGFMIGGGFDYKINKLKLTSDLLFRFMNGKMLSLNLGIAI